VQCNIHPWMTGYLVLRDEPYMAKTDENGKFLIENVPAGTHSFQFWHERCGYLQEVRFVAHGGETTTDKHGKADLSIRAGNNDLGEIKLGVKLFQRRSAVVEKISTTRPHT
jgi:hypothetical protein